MRKLGVLFGLAMLAGSSVAAAAPPRAATVELIQGLRDGTVKLADLVDPARGLVIADVLPSMTPDLAPSRHWSAAPTWMPRWRRGRPSSSCR